MQWWLWSRFGAVVDQAGTKSYGLWSYGNSGAVPPVVEQAGYRSYMHWFYGGIQSEEDNSQHVPWADGNSSTLIAW